jgi:hypothetical protein
MGVIYSWVDRFSVGSTVANWYIFCQMIPFDRSSCNRKWMMNKRCANYFFLLSNLFVAHRPGKNIPTFEKFKPLSPDPTFSVSFYLRAHEAMAKPFHSGTTTPVARPLLVHSSIFDQASERRRTKSETLPPPSMYLKSESALKRPKTRCT